MYIMHRESALELHGHYCLLQLRMWQPLQQVDVCIVLLLVQPPLFQGAVV
jgi:hypothetical protein